MTRSNLSIPAEHPGFAGHFPGAPVLPGVVLLDAMLHAVDQTLSPTTDHAARPGTERASHQTPKWQISAAKFLSAVRPGELLTLEHETLSNGSIRFSIRTADRPIANGVLVSGDRENGATRVD